MYIFHLAYFRCTYSICFCNIVQINVTFIANVENQFISTQELVLLKAKLVFILENGGKVCKMEMALLCTIMVIVT